MQHTFLQVDVFSSEPFMGNPLAVILDADHLSDDTMSKIARWTNLSETAFLMQPTAVEADYKVRIFTPSGELPFAGHPTLGSAHAWLENGGTPNNDECIVQECAAGLVEIKATGETLAFRAPGTIRSGEIEADYLGEIIEAFGITEDMVLNHQWVDNGPGWAVVELPSAQHVLDLEPDFSRIPNAKVGAIGAYPDGAPQQFEARSFAPIIGEDPVCGSMNASVGQWLQRTGRAGTGYRVSQGSSRQRAGEIVISVENKDVWVGGATRTRFRGNAEI